MSVSYLATLTLESVRILPCLKMPQNRMLRSRFPFGLVAAGLKTRPEFQRQIDPGIMSLCCNT